MTALAIFIHRFDKQSTKPWRANVYLDAEKSNDEAIDNNRDCGDLYLNQDELAVLNEKGVDIYAVPLFFGKRHDGTIRGERFEHLPEYVKELKKYR